MTNPETYPSHDHQPPALTDLPGFSLRVHLPTARRKDVEGCINGSATQYAPDSPAATEKDMAELDEAARKAQRLIDTYSGDDAFSRLCAAYGMEAFQELNFLDTIQDYYNKLQEGVLTDEEVASYLEVHVLPEFDTRIYGSILQQVADWGQDSSFPWGVAFGEKVQTWQSNLPPEEREFPGSLCFTEEERQFWNEKLTPTFLPLLEDIEDDREYDSTQMAQLFRDGWERMRQYHGEDLLEDWNFETWPRGTITNSSTKQTLFFGDKVTRSSVTCRETFVHEAMHILQCQWGAEQGKYGALVSFGLPGSSAFREATAKEVGDVFRESRGLAIDYHLAIGAALGAGIEEPLGIQAVADTWYKAACLQYEQAERSKGGVLDTIEKQRHIETMARNHVAERFGRVFVLPESLETRIKAIPVASDTKYAAGAAEAVHELRIARTHIEATGDWGYFARLFCGKWTPSRELDYAVVADYPTEMSRYAKLFVA